MKLNCDLGQIVLGVGVAGLSVSASREAAKPEEMLKHFCGSRVELNIVCDPQSDDDKQDTLIDTTISMQTIADCNSIGISPKKYTFRFSINLEEVDVKHLSQFAHRKSAKIEAKRIGDATSDD